MLILSKVNNVNKEEITKVENVNSGDLGTLVNLGAPMLTFCCKVSIQINSHIKLLRIL